MRATLLFSDFAVNAVQANRQTLFELDLPEIGFHGKATILAVQATNESGQFEGQVKWVARFYNEFDPGTALIGAWQPSAAAIRRWQENCRSIELRLEHPQGGTCHINLTRPVNWLNEVGARIGGRLFLDMPEMGARGWAEVLDISPPAVPEPKPVSTPNSMNYRLVTGTFRHSHGLAGDLVLESEPEPIGVTASHPFWSVDRKSWVRAGDLRSGETLQTLIGTTQVVSYTLRSSPETVYNLEVEGDPVYRVGTSGILVHNESASTKGDLPACRAWQQNLDTEPASSSDSIEAKFERTNCGSIQYHLVGGGASIKADGIDGCSVLDCKAVRNPEKSPQLGNADPTFLQIYIAHPEGKANFESSLLRDAIRALPGVIDWKEPYDLDPVGTLFVCSLETGDEKVYPIPIRVPKDLGCVSLGAYHPRGLAAALEIQKSYGREIFAFSEESSPDVVALSSIASPQELAEKLKLWE